MLSGANHVATSNEKRRYKMSSVGHRLYYILVIV